MNIVTLIGRLTKDPNVTHGKTKAGEDMTLARFTLAVDRRFSRDEEQSADFISCVVFSKRAETIEKYVSKGTKLAIQGHIQTGSYKNKDGNTIYTTDVIVDDFEFAESRAAVQNNVSETKPAPAPAEKDADPKDGFMNIADGIDDDELPFD